MKSIAIISVHALLLVLGLSLVACSGSSKPESSHAERGVDGKEHGEEPAEGPRGGRLLQDGEFALEITIFESAVVPEFRLYPSISGKPVSPKDVQVTMALRRINGQPNGMTDQHRFVPKDDYLLSATEVYEPHSFEVTVKASYAGKSYNWHYDSPEAVVVIAADMAAASGMKMAAVSGGALHEKLSLYGSIQPDPEHMRDVSARFPGIVRSVSVQVGDAVRKGQTLATIESNESLQVYAVTAPIAGTITARLTNPGESAGATELFEIADFSSVWAELSVFPRDRGRLKAGQMVSITAADGAGRGSGIISFVSPVGAANQALTTRVVLDNGNGQWTPGQFVNASVTVGESSANLVVPMTAVQSFRNWDVVFVAEGDRYQAQPVKLGRQDGENVEVLSGVTPGARVVVVNSYLVKADIEKSGAAHDH